MSFKKGKRTQKNYDQLHEDLQKVIDLALKVSQVDFTVIEGHRTVERQYELYRAGKSKIDGKKRKGKHNFYPSRAFDFIAAVPGKPLLIYDLTHLMYLVGVFTSCGEILRQSGEIKSTIRSGANWDMDGELKYDQSFFDAPHIEII